MNKKRRTERIVEINNGLKIYFVVQYRVLWIFWVTYIDSNEHEIKFNCLEDAETFVRKPTDFESERVVYKTRGGENE